MTPDNWLIIIGFISVIFTLYRINLVLDQEFSDEDAFIKDPLTSAACTTIDFEKFKENNWKGFEALWAAIRFRTFYKLFTPVISPRDAKLCAFGMLSLFIMFLCFAQMAKADPKVYNMIGGITAVLNLLWWAIIEHGKYLKKSVEKLQIKK